MVCGLCGKQQRDGRKFCAACGGSLAPGCPACGASLETGDRFCGECGAAVAAPTEPAAPLAERRLVSVLFADLVGFTAASAGRDAEETRELLSRYFDTSRRLIELYGGTVEKFIGDAVMAVWGAPIATEDDAERAVRAALDLVTAVSALGQELGLHGLAARAGVLTGEAAVTIGATAEGMVAGDLVNTASRVQSAAEPGEVFVGEATRRATEQTIVFEEAGAFPLKGKDGLTPLWRARRVVAGLGGSLRSQGLEAPFVGRDRELRQMKDLFHRAGDERRAHLVSVTGIAGIGKSRLVWEFYKYFDGIAVDVYWHRGRCLSYGEGVTYWALADMVRMRCRIAEDEPAADALAKLARALDEHVPDPEERAFVEPRVAHLLGLGEFQARDQRDLFAAWRLLFERLADSYPVVLAFEDLQWADASLLDFIEHLLDWSRDSPILVIALARPELVGRRPGWGAGQRSFTSVYLDPLPAPAMEALLAGLVPGVPPQLRDAILARAEGVPLYAVETVRTLLDRGLLIADGSSYRITGPIDTLAVPETLHALIASRLDGLPADERHLVQDASVLGKAFTTAGLRSLAGADVDVEPLLASLVRKELIGLQADPRSPEYGQHVFLQDLVRHVAYETLARRDRRVRHLAAAAYLASGFEDELIEVIASHYLAADEAVPDAPDAPAVRGQARAMLERAGHRSESLGAAQEASRYYEQAAGLADTSPERASLLARAGSMAGRSGDIAAARRSLAQAIALLEEAGDTHAAARAVGRLARLESFTERRDDALAEMLRAYAVIAADEPDEDLALLAGYLSLGYWYSGELDRATEFAERALDIAETHAYQHALVVALRCRAGIAVSRGHRVESGALLDRALALALEHDDVDEAHSLYVWLSDLCFQRDDYASALGHLDEVLALSRRVGDRPREWTITAERTYVLLMTGRWDEALSELGPGLQLTRNQIDNGALLQSAVQSAVEIHVKRGEVDRARDLVALFEGLAETSDIQAVSGVLANRASLRRAEGRLEEALAEGIAAVDVAHTFGIASQSAKQGLVEALEAALALGRRDTVEELLGRIDAVPAGSRPPYLDAHARRFRARLDGDAAGYAAAAEGFRALGLPFWLAVTLLEHAELSGDRTSLDEARSIFGQLRATPWLERAATAQGVGTPV